MDTNRINIITLAYMGDAIYEVYVREYLIKKGYYKVNELQKQSINFVSAKRQAFYLKKLIEKNFFDETELDVIKRARNAKINSKPKNCDILTYKHGTAFESIIGNWYFEDKNNKIKDMFEEIIKMEEEN